MDAVRPRGQRLPGAAAFAAAAITIVAVFCLNIPYFAIRPGPAIDVVELIDISTAETKPVSGRLLLTTVSVSGRIRVAAAIRGWLDSSYEVLPESVLIAPGETNEEAEQRSTEQMQQSHENAAAAALTHLGYDVKITPLGLRVADFDSEAPARNVLRRGDIIVGADAASVKEAADLETVVKRHRIGDEIVLKVMRGGETLTLRTTTIEREGEPRIGVLLVAAPQIELPLAIDIDARDIGGPSAGLMYALGIVDLLDDDDLAQRRTVAGTGEITIDGEVRPVGGITQKLAGARDTGADLFLVPKAEHVDACAHADGLDVYAVDNLAEAVRVLKDPSYASSKACR